MQIELLRVTGFEKAARGMRLSHQSKSTSNVYIEDGQARVASDDLELMLKLVIAGHSHAKFARFIMAYFDIIAPRYWWQEFDTYKVGVERLSDSTMHNALKRPFTVNDFEDGEVSSDTLTRLNTYRKMADLILIKKYLPEGYLQRRVVIANYQALRPMYEQRKNHKLPEWKQFCNTLESMPFAELITVEGVSNE